MSTTRVTTACELGALEPALLKAIRLHAAKYGVEDLEAGVLMCCQTVSTLVQGGLFGGTRREVSAVFVTPKWLGWAESTGRGEAAAGSGLLRRIEMRDFQASAQNTATPDAGLNITGRYTDKHRTGIVFIALDGGPDGMRFREVLKAALREAAAMGAPAAGG